MFGKNKLFIFEGRILQELIIASLVIVKSILNPFSAAFHV